MDKDNTKEHEREGGREDLCAITMEDGSHATVHILRNWKAVCSRTVILYDSAKREKYGFVPVKVHNGCPKDTPRKLGLTAIMTKDGK